MRACAFRRHCWIVPVIRGALALLLLALLTWVGTEPAWAADSGNLGPSVQRQARLQQPAATDEFVPISELPPQDQLPAAPLLMAAYAFVWVALLVYVGLLWRRLTQVERELTSVARRLEEARRD